MTEPRAATHDELVALYDAIEADDVAAVERLASAIPHARAHPLRKGMPPLCYAAAMGAPRVVARLLASGESAGERAPVYGTPLHCALGGRLSKPREVVAALLAAGADANAWTDPGLFTRSVLAMAIATRDTVLVQELLDAGARLDLSEGDLAADSHRIGARPLVVADTAEMVDFLLDRGADPDRCAPPGARRTVVAAAAIAHLHHRAAALRMIERGRGLAAHSASGQNALDELLHLMASGACLHTEDVAVALVAAGVKPSQVFEGRGLPDRLRRALAERGLVSAAADAEMKRDAEAARKRNVRSVAATLAAHQRRRAAEERPQRALFSAADAGEEPAGDHRYVVVHYDWQAAERGYLHASRASKSFLQQLRSLGKSLRGWGEPGAAGDDLAGYLATLRDPRVRSLAAAALTSPLEFLPEGSKIGADDAYLGGVATRYPGARVMCGWSAVSPLADVAFAILRLPARGGEAPTRSRHRSLA